MRFKEEDGWKYLGDGVYINDKGYEIVLVTYDGLRVSDTIVLEPSHIKTLHEIVKGR